MALVQFTLPDLGEGVAETEVVRWLVAEGDTLTADAPMVEVMTDKATVEIPSPADGVVEVIHVADGTVVPVGTVLVTIEAEGPVATGTAHGPGHDAGSQGAANVVAPDESNTAPAAAERRGVRATPLVRRIARELGVDLSTVTPTGPGGKVTEDDVRAAAAGGASTSGTVGAVRRVPLHGVRRTIAQHLTDAQRVPTVTVVEEVDLSALEQHRSSRSGGYIPYLVQAAVAGFSVVPEANAIFDERTNELVVHEQVNMGIAVQTSDGLVVPVLSDCAGTTLDDLDTRVSELGERAKSGSLTPADLHGGTFTITSAGKFGGLFTTPLLNVPQVAILGLHRIDQRPVVRDGEIVVQQMANLSLSFDHRAFDGIQASTYLLAVIDHLESIEI